MKKEVTGKVEIKKNLKRKALIKSAAKIFSEKGYIETSIKNITDDAGVAVGTFYKYFETKDDILKHLYEEIINISVQSAEKIAKDEEGSSEKKFVKALAGAFCVYALNKELSKVCLIKTTGINAELEEKRIEIINKTNEYIKAVLKHLKENHKAQIMNIDISSVIITYSMLGSITYWLEDKLNESLKDVILAVCIHNLNSLKLDFNENEIAECIDEIIEVFYKNEGDDSYEGV